MKNNNIKFKNDDSKTVSSYIDTPIGILQIVTGDESLKELRFCNLNSISDDNKFNDYGKVVKKQLEQYFKSKRDRFELNVSPIGTEFQHKIWRELVKIPFGETNCYGDIAEAIDNAKASRAVGMANNKNPIAVVIPCHRVIGKNGDLVGYAGGIDIKEFLLNLEQSY